MRCFALVFMFTQHTKVEHEEDSTIIYIYIYISVYIYIYYIVHTEDAFLIVGAFGKILNFVGLHC